MIYFKVDENKVLHIYSVIMLRRSDKQPDRVEISPEQLSDASSKAEVGHSTVTTVTIDNVQTLRDYKLRIYLRQIFKLS